MKLEVNIQKYKIDPKTKYEYQALGKEIADKCGVKFPIQLFTNPKWSLDNVRIAWEIADRKKIYKIGYIVGIIKRL